MNIAQLLRTTMAAAAVVSTLGMVPSAGAATTTAAPTASDRLNEPGPEAQALARRVGAWDGPGAAPVTVTGLIAQRRMIGPMLEEILSPGPDATVPPFSRADYLTFSRIEGRWQYMSMDSRVPLGLMPAWSLDADPEQRIFVSFQPFATPGTGFAGPVATGQMWRMEQVISRLDADHEQKDQYFTPAGDAPVKWLGKRYSYTRRR
ncbi:hypothetical protein [Mitsuaria sp. 7]|uniref:hypothetical protein n=1 Tax=Mitsuaria sp. 7 TaxID=1658665 RepID=UPI0007DCD85C|nr:hypothetical protein [Mitsuaria sp. 7]ANH67392.1 hypothetical protein ABE85_07085 [Mitsuaria sp. 7]